MTDFPMANYDEAVAIGLIAGTSTPRAEPATTAPPPSSRRSTTWSTFVSQLRSRGTTTPAGSESRHRCSPSSCSAPTAEIAMTSDGAGGGGHPHWRNSQVGPL